MMKKRYNRDYKKGIIYIVFWLFFLWFAEQVPYTHDDWDWGLDIGLWQFVSASVNSRYAGNFLVILMTRSPAAKTLIMGSVLFALVLALSKLAVKSLRQEQTECDSLPAFLMSSFLLLTMSSRIFRQTISWVAGFSNFVASALPLTVFLYEILDIFTGEEKNQGNSTIKNCMLFLMCVVMQLFIENLTVFTMGLSAVVLIVRYVSVKKIDAKYVAMFAGCLLGTGIMFSSSVYSSLIATESAVDGYRQLSVSRQSGLLENILDFCRQGARLVGKTWCENQVLCLVILIMLFVLIMRNQNAASRKKKAVLIAANGVLAFYLIFRMVYRRDALWESGLADVIRVIFSFVFFVMCSCEIVAIYKQDKMRLMHRLFFWFSAQIVILPLLITTEAGDRLFFTSNVLLILFVLHLLYDILPELPPIAARNVIAGFLAAEILVIAYIAVLFAQIGKCRDQRMRIVEKAAREGAVVVELPAYPHADYLWFPDPATDQRWEYFKEFYGISPEAEVIIR